MRHRQEMPEVFAKGRDADCVVVSGDLDFDAPTRSGSSSTKGSSSLFA